MNAHDLLLQGIQYLMEAGIATLVPFVINLLIHKIGLAKFQRDQLVAALIVKSIQETMGPGNGADKKAVVEQVLSNKLKGALTPADINHLIQSAVYDMKQDAAKAQSQAAQAQEQTPAQPEQK